MFSSQMIVLTYVIRGGSDKRGYNPWLRQIDNPFFNSVPSIDRYENWKLVSNEGVTWTHFDLLHPAKGVAPQEVFQDPVVTEFAANWSRLWGVNPDTQEQSVNYQIHILERVRQGQKLRGGLLAMVFNPDIEKLPTQAEVWRAKSMVVGDNQLGAAIALLPLTFANSEIDEGWGEHILIGECIASPHG